MYTDKTMGCGLIYVAFITTSGSANCVITSTLPDTLCRWTEADHNLVQISGQKVPDAKSLLRYETPSKMGDEGNYAGEWSCERDG